ncbi:hypothetical protein F0U60_32670 [Archangium minus]|uniref:C-type lectin domain-containing protein n=1 Tax=Archangium minus TaxID=83450 RepID=A0ABY9WYY0_9BACT|nr:hypothetical protein F0U60_32670 [Archangium minus]
MGLGISTPAFISKEVPVSLRSIPGLLSLLFLACAEEPAVPEPEALGAQRQEIELRETWAAKAAVIQQRDLQRDVPLDRWQRLGTHNSHVSTVYTKCGAGLCYYLRSNQHRSLAAQLDMGIRTLMLDVYDDANSNSTGDCQFGWNVCFSHEGEPFGQWSVALEDEIAGWINAPEHQEDVLLILLEDYFNEGEAYKRQFFNELRYRFDKDYRPGVSSSLTSGDLIFRPSDKQLLFPNRWPTPRELVQLGRRIVIAVKDRSAYNIDLGADGNLRDWFFGSGSLDTLSVQYPAWAANFAPQFDAARCGSKDIRDASQLPQPLPHRFTQFEERQICDHFENCYGGSGLSDRIDVAAVMACGFSVAMDQAEADPSYSPGGESYFARSLKGAIWSFDEGEPNNAGDEDCAAMWSNGRWNDDLCSKSKRYACVKAGATCDPSSCPGDFWVLSANTGPWSGGAASCPAGYRFGVPLNGFHNRKLRELVGGREDVWLHFTDGRVEGRWESP